LTYLHVGLANNAKSFVDFVEINLLGSNVGVLQSLGDRKRRSGSEFLRGLLIRIFSIYRPL
jgi:hypothetical protein